MLCIINENSYDVQAIDFLTKIVMHFVTNQS